MRASRTWFHATSYTLACALAACSGASSSPAAPGNAADASTDGAVARNDDGDAAVGASDAAVDSAARPDADASSAVSYTLQFIPGSAYSLYASLGGGAPHPVQLDTGSDGLYVPKSVVGTGAQISTTDTCSITYVSSGNTLSGHIATGSVTLLGSTTAGDLPSPPSTVPMTFCAVDDATFTGGVMGVGFGRPGSVPTQNVLLQMKDIGTGAMRAGYVLSTHPSPNVQIGITAARSAGFQTIALTPSATVHGDWVATSLKGCVTLPGVSAFAQECGGLLVDTGVPETILWGPTDATLGGIVPSGQTTVPTGTAVQIATESAGAATFSFVLGTGADSPSAVDVKNASAFSINTGRAILVDYDYLFDAQAGVVGFQRM